MRSRDDFKQLVDIARIAVAATVLIASFPIPERPKRAHVEREKKCFYEATESLSDKDFQTMFRVSRSAFRLLVEHLRPFLSRFNSEQREEELAAHLSGKCLQLEVRIGLFLRMMSGASHHDLGLAFGVGASTVYQVFKSVMEVVLEEMRFQEIPADFNGLKECALEFAESRPVSNPLQGCIGSLDGIAVRVEKPSSKWNPAQFYCRKEYYSVPVQAVVDSQYRFMAVSAMCVGSTHDSLAFELSSVAHYIKSGHLPLGFWIAADDAYRCSEHIITPFSRSTAGRYQDSFNFFQSSHRIHVEQAFGFLKKRWGILWRPLGFEMRTNVKIVPTAMLLHNFCVNYDRGYTKRWRSPEEWKAASVRLDEWLEFCQRGEDNHLMEVVVEDMGTAAKRAETRSTVRGNLVTVLRRLALLRPSNVSSADKEEGHNRFVIEVVRE